MKEPTKCDLVLLRMNPTTDTEVAVIVKVNPATLGGASATCNLRVLGDDGAGMRHETSVPYAAHVPQDYPSPTWNWPTATWNWPTEAQPKQP